MNSQETIDHAKAEFLRAEELLLKSLATTPEERINWSPAPTARTPIEQVAHSAQSLESICGFMNGHAFSIETTGEADDFFREYEKQFTTREAVVAVWKKNSAAYLQFLDALTPEALATLIQLPFGMGQAPLKEALAFPPLHTKWHASQIDYIQTIYGDRIWH
ncbi:MAG TPA: DinB family protein [Abditibacteriaceae bacterium]|jgi:hypothetical protein